MDVKITVREVSGVSVIRLHGRIVLGPESSSLRDAIKQAVADGKLKILLDMSEVTYIDSAGLGILVAGYVSGRNHGASIKLSGLGNKFREIMQITRLFTIFDIYDTSALAIARFSETEVSLAAGGNS